MKTNAKQLAAARRAMEVIAAREGISVEEVRREISLAILMAQPRNAGIVSEIPCAGAVPTPEELIACCAARIQRERRNSHGPGNSRRCQPLQLFFSSASK